MFWVPFHLTCILPSVYGVLSFKYIRERATCSFAYGLSGRQLCNERIPENMINLEHRKWSFSCDLWARSIFRKLSRVGETVCEFDFHSWFSRMNRETSLMVQWVRIHLSMQGTQTQSLVQEDSIGLGATKPIHHNYWSLSTLEAIFHERSHCNGKPTHCN